MVVWLTSNQKVLVAFLRCRSPVVQYTLMEMSSAKNNGRTLLIRDTALVVFSILIAVILARTDVLIDILSVTEGSRYAGSFLAGMFFTSIFTAAPAAVTLGELAQENNVLAVALLGALGAVIGDLIIFNFVRDRLSKHFSELLKISGVYRRSKALFKIRAFRWMFFLLGGLIIASPLTDEIGISMLGLSKVRAERFIPLSFLFNFLGILAIGFIASSL